MCNVIYWIIAKVLANWLKGLLDDVISGNQSAFIPNHLITDNVIVGYECLHKLRSCKKGKNGLVALKLDVSKAYDRMDWGFLEQVMVQLGFSSKWIRLIMSFVTTSKLSFLINGEVRGRGIR